MNTKIIIIMIMTFSLLCNSILANKDLDEKYELDRLIINIKKEYQNNENITGYFMGLNQLNQTIYFDEFEILFSNPNVVLHKIERVKKNITNNYILIDNNFEVLKEKIEKDGSNILVFGDSKRREDTVYKFIAYINGSIEKKKMTAIINVKHFSKSLSSTNNFNILSEKSINSDNSNLLLNKYNDLPKINKVLIIFSGIIFILLIVSFIISELFKKQNG